ncbi:sugar ABC transporter substrate-binding protein [Hathewaya histolytica]|uniref:Sugar transporter, substrate-binding lipoprotein n=1 Tax=Hathewaya histolytica TaxID=1498 RepID=A0A4V6KBI9_HATHI|nr:sugar ABC transporter substrate-binding protein [Hathewaya histolytica]VTQ82757.1 sugar transporter, substrate-binding lipoprotein [Hathewaya histolytica]
MKRFTKILSIFLLASVCTMSLAACTGTKGEKKESAKNQKEETLKLWLPPIGENDKPVWEPILKEFEEKNKCKVDLEIIPWENYPEKYATAIAAGEGPDVGYMYAEMFPQFIEMKAVEDLTPYLKKEDYDKYTYIEDGKMLGGLYGLAIEAANPAVLYYNKDILNKLGEKPPVTWEDFRRISKKATKDTNGDGKIDQWGFAQGWGQKFFGDLNWNWYGFLWQAGGELYNKDLKTVRFNDEAGQKTAQLLYDLKFTDKVLPNDHMGKTNKEMLQSHFGNGNAAFCIYLSSAAGEILDKSFPKLNYGFITSLQDKTKGTFASVDQLVLMSKAKNKKLAFNLMEHMLNKESMTKFHKYHPRAPITKDEPYQGDPRLKEMVEKEKGVYRPLVVAPHGVEVYENLWKELQRMMSGQTTPKKALDDAAKYSNDLLAK